ncbi:hypothetical protein SCHPADRAFT_1001087 [Schizopora paradoxa]|uniref:F-box domain-containing protein n=1 Tax=Schizopora paradoxa TaxID=27342 RepID=A0A0H2RA28_9AGAM|nr:hypothetical protein SCHPADRAFT_1001087 [Schizopora paradoxa]
MSCSKSQDRDVETVIVPNQEDEDALEVIADVAKALLRANDFFKSRPDWYKDFVASKSVPLLHSTPQAKEDAEALARAEIIREVLEPANEVSRDVSSWISKQWSFCDAQIKSLRIRSWFMAIPDEILSVILKFAARQKYGNTYADFAVKHTVKEATKLSHVCSRFRNVVLRVADVWNCVSPSMHPDAVSTCFDRCGPSGFNVLFSGGSFEKDNHSFFRQIAEKAHLWNRFELIFYPDLQYYVPAMLIPDLDTLRSESIGINTSLLNQLVIHYPFRVLKDEIYNGLEKDALHFYSTWSSPSLRSMSCKNFVPIPFPGTSALSYISIELAFHFHESGICAYNATAIASFLSSCQALTNFSMKIRACTAVIPSPPNQKYMTSHVKSMELLFACCTETVVSSFLDAVSFPDVESLRVSCNSRGLEDYGSGVQHLPVLDAAFPYDNVFPKLSHLELIISSADPCNPHLTRFAPARPVSLPFAKFSRIRSLLLTTETTLLKPLPETLHMPNLKDLHVTNCWGMTYDWFCAMYKKMVLSQDVETAPIRLLVDGTAWDDYFGVTFGKYLSGTLTSDADVDRDLCKKEVTVIVSPGDIGADDFDPSRTQEHIVRLTKYVRRSVADAELRSEVDR